MARKQGEQPSTKAYFEMYAAMGPERSFEKLAHQIYQKQVEEGALTPKETTWLSKLKKWSAVYNWQEKVVEYDRKIIQAQAIKRAQLVEQMNSEHALLGRTHALRAAKMIGELSEQGRMSSTAVVALLKIATDLERVARGAETEITRTIEEQPKEHKHTIAFDLSKLTDEQLEKLEQVAGEIESPGMED